MTEIGVNTSKGVIGRFMQQRWVFLALKMIFYVSVLSYPFI